MQPLVKKTLKKEDIIGSETIIENQNWHYKETELMTYEYQRIVKSKDEKIELDCDDLSLYKDN